MAIGNTLIIMIIAVLRGNRNKRCPPQAEAIPVSGTGMTVLAEGMVLGTFRSPVPRNPGLNSAWEKPKYHGVGIVIPIKIFK